MKEEEITTNGGDGDEIRETKTGTILDKGKPHVWAVTGTGKDTLPITVSVISLAEGGLSLQLDGQEPQAWITASDDMLGVVVVNNYNNTVVCMKTFAYVNGQLQLFK